MLHFLDEPSAPGKPDIVDYDNKSVTLNWKAPDNDGEPLPLRQLPMHCDLFHFIDIILIFIVSGGK